MSIRYAPAAILAAAMLITPPGAGAKPLDVGVQVSGKPVSRVIGPSGGTLTLRSAAGRLRLVVPRGALSARTRITIRAIRPTRHWPLGSAAAVQLTPDGLDLARPATLTITPRRPIARSQQATFAWQGAGRGAHLYPPLTATRAIVLGISHFCGYGVARASNGQVATLNRRLPNGVGPEIEAAIGSVLVDAKRNKLPFDGAVLKDRLAAALVPLYEQLAARLHAAEGGGNWRGPVATAATLDDLLALLGYNHETLGFHPPVSRNAAVNARLEALRQDIQGSFWRVYDNAYARAKRACSMTGRYEHADEMFNIGAQLNLLGNPQHQIPIDQLENDVAPCKCVKPQQKAWVTPDGVAVPVTVRRPAGAKEMCWPARRYTATLTATYDSAEQPGHIPDDHFRATITATFRLDEVLLLPGAQVRAEYRLASFAGSYSDSGRSDREGPDSGGPNCQWSGGGALSAIDQSIFLFGDSHPRLRATVQWNQVEVPQTCTWAYGGMTDDPYQHWLIDITVSDVPLAAGTFGELITGQRADDPNDFEAGRPVPAGAHVTKTWRYVAQR